jgi:hypothetical protein
MRQNNCPWEYGLVGIVSEIFRTRNTDKKTAIITIGKTNFASIWFSPFIQ